MSGSVASNFCSSASGRLRPVAAAAFSASGTVRSGSTEASAVELLLERPSSGEGAFEAAEDQRQLQAGPTSLGSAELMWSLSVLRAVSRSVRSAADGLVDAVEARGEAGEAGLQRRARICAMAPASAPDAPAAIASTCAFSVLSSVSSGVRSTGGCGAGIEALRSAICLVDGGDVAVELRDGGVEADLGLAWPGRCSVGRAGRCSVVDLLRPARRRSRSRSGGSG